MVDGRPPCRWATPETAVSGVAHLQSVEGSSMAGTGETLGSSLPPLAIRPCLLPPLGPDLRPQGRLTTATRTSRRRWTTSVASILGRPSSTPSATASRCFPGSAAVNRGAQRRKAWGAQGDRRRPLAAALAKFVKILMKYG
jgi:hypothetical protein